MKHAYPARLSAALLLATSMAQATTVELVWEVRPDQHKLTTMVDRDVHVTMVEDPLLPFEMRYRFDIGNEMAPTQGPTGSIQLFAPLKASGSSMTPYSAAFSTDIASKLPPDMAPDTDAAFWQELPDGTAPTATPTAFQTLSMRTSASWRQSGDTSSGGIGYSRDIIVAVQGKLVDPILYRTDQRNGAAFLDWLPTLLGQEGNFQETGDTWRNELLCDGDLTFWRNENRMELIGGKAALKSFAVVPEPSAWSLLLSGLTVVIGAARKARSIRPCPATSP